MMEFQSLQRLTRTEERITNMIKKIQDDENKNNDSSNTQKNISCFFNKHSTL